MPMASRAIRSTSRWSATSPHSSRPCSPPAGTRPTRSRWAASLRIAESVILHRPDPDAPVSALYVFGRKQDLAFQQDVGGSADQRHHVRWWRVDTEEVDGRPLWIGDAAFDRGAGISHRTGQITHHIAPDIDAERDYLMASLEQAGQLAGRYEWPGIGATRQGRNAADDPYTTDGMIAVGILKAGAGP